MIGRRLVWALWLAAAALLWLFENNAATLALLAASVLIPAASILAARLRRKRVLLSAQAKDAALEIQVKGLGPVLSAAGTVFGENRLTGEEAQTDVYFSPRFSGESRKTVKFETAHCGTLRLRAEIRVQDLFGLWRSAPLPCGEEFVTLQPELFLPAVILAENSAVSADSEQYSQTRPGSDPSETFAIREYIPGDPIRQIHWKLSQKTDTLMMRELGLPVISQTLLVFRNLRMQGEAVSPETADTMARAFLSVSHALVSDGTAHTAAFAENDRFTLMQVHNEVDFHALQAQFLTIGWEAEGGALARLLTETPSAHVVIVSAAVPPDAERLPMGSRVTLLLASPGEAVPGLYTVPFTAEKADEILSILEI